MKSVEIYTDGACSGNPGPGGYGVILKFEGVFRELSGGCKLTTNNRMELKAVIEGLSALKERCRVQLYTDSKLIVDAITKGWLTRWSENNWKRNKREKVENVDLWIELLKVCSGHEVQFNWIRGHSGHKENERCDYLARNAIKKYDRTFKDNYYESNSR